MSHCVWLFIRTTNHDVSPRLLLLSVKSLCYHIQSGFIELQRLYSQHSDTFHQFHCSLINLLGTCLSTCDRHTWSTVRHETAVYPTAVSLGRSRKTTNGKFQWRLALLQGAGGLGRGRPHTNNYSGQPVQLALPAERHVTGYCKSITLPYVELNPTHNSRHPTGRFLRMCRVTVKTSIDVTFTMFLCP